MGDWESGTEEGISVYFVIFSSLLAVVLILSKVLHDHEVVASLLPEVGMILLVGFVAGTLVTLVAKEPENEGDDEDVIKTDITYVEIILPAHCPICLFACIGTLVSTIVVALILKAAVHFELTGTFYPTLSELFTFGALISATDPVSTLAVFQSKRVDPHLFYLVFGESVLNDAVGLVLFNAFAKFVQVETQYDKVAVEILTFLIDFTFDFIGSSVLGVVSALLAALLLKKVDMRKTPLLELSLYVLIMYVPYLCAEILRMSGITNSEAFFRLAAHIAEVSIFLELGLCVFPLFAGEGNFQWRFILWAILACLIGRAANVYPIAFFFNRSLRDEIPLMTYHESDKNEFVGHFEMTDITEEKKDESNAPQLRMQSSMTPESRRDLKIRWKTAHMLWFSGLRGAVAYACVRSFPDTFNHQTEFVVVTMAIVLVTVFLLGGATELLLNYLNIEMNVDEDRYMESSPNARLLQGSCELLKRISFIDYQQQFEVSETEHLETVFQMKKKESLYDYGSYDPS
ncbi:potassium:proton antiporter [Fragilaria crotonensis]|nr:potassium:proton antiporter [Fragilaria crotonensis]